MHSWAILFFMVNKPEVIKAIAAAIWQPRLVFSCAGNEF